jgi:hypothetical protein
MEKLMRLHSESTQRLATGLWSPAVLKDELAHALFEALYELELLPADNDDAAMIGLYAIMDDVRQAIARTEAMDLPSRQQH